MTDAIDLVTGATGFIGGHLAMRLLARGRPLRLLVRPGSEAKLPQALRGAVEILQGDLSDPWSVAPAVRGATRVFHCAGYVSDWGSRALFERVNVEGTRHLLESACASGVARFVHLSSIAVFGVPSPPFFDDASAYGPGNDPYSATKIAAEKLALAYHRTRQLPVTALRPGVVYGPRGAWLEEPLRLARANRLVLVGGGAGSCHPCYIENLLDAIELVAGRPEAVGEAYLVGDGETISFSDFFNSIARLAGRDPVRRSVPVWLARFLAAGFEARARARGQSDRPLLTRTAIDMVCTQSRMSAEKIRERLHYRPRFSFGQAMTDLASGRRQDFAS